MIDIFLKAKHWQLFLISTGVPLLFQFILMGTMFSSILNEGAPHLDAFFTYFNVFPLIMILFTGILFGWFWSIAIGLDKWIPKNLKLKTNRFKLFLFIPVIYITLISFLIGSVMKGIIYPENLESILPVFGLIIPLHLFSMFCIFYCLYFVAKTIKTVELQKEVSFGDFVGEFFLLWFYPVGIWIIQPKINKMFQEKTSSYTGHDKT